MAAEDNKSTNGNDQRIEADWQAAGNKKLHYKFASNNL